MDFHTVALFLFTYITTDAHPGFLLKVQYFTLLQWNIQIRMWLFCSTLLVRDSFIWNRWNSQYTPLFNIKEQCEKVCHTGSKSAAWRTYLLKFCNHKHVIALFSPHSMLEVWNTLWTHTARSVAIPCSNREKNNKNIFLFSLGNAATSSTTTSTPQHSRSI